MLEKMWLHGNVPTQLMDHIYWMPCETESLGCCADWAYWRLRVGAHGLRLLDEWAVRKRNESQIHNTYDIGTLRKYCKIKLGFMFNIVSSLHIHCKFQEKYNVCVSKPL